VRERTEADANARDVKGNLPLHAAAHNGEAELVRLLLPRTRQPQAKNREQRTARDYALAGGHDEIAKLLAARR
jgi:ankyrin repeat protein